SPTFVVGRATSAFVAVASCVCSVVVVMSSPLSRPTRPAPRRERPRSPGAVPAAAPPTDGRPTTRLRHAEIARMRRGPRLAGERRSAAPHRAPMRTGTTCVPPGPPSLHRLSSCPSSSLRRCVDWQDPRRRVVLRRCLRPVDVPCYLDDPLPDLLGPAHLVGGCRRLTGPAVLHRVAQVADVTVEQVHDEADRVGGAERDVACLGSRRHL